MIMQKKYSNVVSVLLATSLLGYTQIASAATSARSHPAHAQTQHGVAVWYGEDHQGETMANGQSFNQWAMTGASVHFPLGTRVRVTDLATHKHVVVTITDYTKPRSRVLVDLSHGAGKALGIETTGKAHVAVQTIGFDPSQTRAATAHTHVSPRLAESRN
jgi:rare lipoprotein A